MVEVAKLEGAPGEAEPQARRLSGYQALAARILATALSLYILVYISTSLNWFNINLYGSHRALAYSFIIVLVFLHFPASPGASRDRVPWYDYLLAAAGLTSTLYAFFSWDDWLFGVGIPTGAEEVLGAVLILVSLEACRRCLGLGFTCVTALFVIYPMVGHLLPGVLRTQPNSFSALIQNFYFAGTSNGVFGSPMEIFTTTVAIFLIYGAFLTATGAGNVFLDSALAIAGRYRAGMAKVSVLASALFGTISGVGAANVLVTGGLTIPAMKRLGYRPALAGAVEAAASTGGLLMPPVMGAAAFLMADMLGVPYLTVAKAALIPAILYFLAVFMMVDFEGGRDGLGSVPASEIPPLGATLRDGWYLYASIAALLVALGWYGLPVDQAAFAGLIMLVGLSILRRRGLRVAGAFNALEQSGRLLGALGVTGAAVGMITGGFALTGLGAVLPQALQALAGGSLFLLLILSAVSAIILGMGAPPVLVYVLLATTVAPAIIDAGVPKLAAHMFIFYYGLLSMLTPPVALCSMIAARVAGANFWVTSINACRLAVVAYIIPFFFVYNPVLLFEGHPSDLLRAFPSAVVGTVALSGALTRFFFLRRLGFGEAFVLGLGGLMLFSPDYTTDMLGAALIAPTIIFTLVAWRKRRLVSVGQ
ncbi:MAG: TRAP transporter fused permease subunit [Beijerinckiaceae bacterium]|nr:TRAP transporter fused permease subunit [Beijerinckiaceae bacterium]